MTFKAYKSLLRSLLDEGKGDPEVKDTSFLCIASSKKQELALADRSICFHVNGISEAPRMPKLW